MIYKLLAVLLVALLWADASLAACAVTHNFVAGNTAVADNVDQNFTDLRTCVEALQSIVADGDKGDITLATTGTSWTIDANAVALGTDTTGNYVATIADSGASEITVTGSGSETAAVTLAIASAIARDSEVTSAVDARALPSSGQTDDRLVKTSGTAGDVEGTGIAVDSSNNMTVPGSITTGGTEVPSCFVLRNRADSGNVACDVNGTTFTCEADTNGVCNDAT